LQAEVVAVFVNNEAGEVITLTVHKSEHIRAGVDSFPEFIRTENSLLEEIKPDLLIVGTEKTKSNERVGIVEAEAEELSIVTC